MVLMPGVFVLLLSMLLFSCAFWVAAWASVARLMRPRPVDKGEEATNDRVPWPSVSILKPLKGVEPNGLENFTSFCRQDYPGRIELMFAIADTSDPAAEVVRGLRFAFPTHSISMLVAPRLGANPKTALLHNLARQANGEVLVLSDSDVRVGPRYLREVVRPLRERPGVGVVTCPYRVERGSNIAARLEALGRVAFLMPAAIFAATVLHEPLGMGATIAVRRRDLERSGSFALIADHLADDNQLARQIRSLGLSIQMSSEVVSIVSDGWCSSLSGLWDREARWARCERVACGSVKYLGMSLTFTTALALLTLVCFEFWRGRFAGWLLELSGGAVLLRLMAAWRSSVLLGYRLDLIDALLFLPRALLAPVIWISGLVGDQVIWRGQHFVLQRDGRLKRYAPAPASAPVRWAGEVFDGITRRIDAALRRRQGIIDMGNERLCILRISYGSAAYDVQLRDGTSIAAGDPVAELHLRNESFFEMQRDAGLGWGRELMKRAELSFLELAKALETDPLLAGVVAVHGAGSFVRRRGNVQLRRMLGRLGLEVREDPRPRSLLRRFHELGENILIWMLTRANNPSSLQGKPLFSRPRQHLWISRQKLLDLYGQGANVVPHCGGPLLPSPTRQKDVA